MNIVAAFEQWAEDAHRFPLADRIAARLHLEGVDEERFRTSFRYFPIHPLVHIRLLDIQHGHLTVGPRLTQLAMELPL